MKKSALLLALAAVSVAASADPYKVTVPLGKDYDGAMAYIVNFDTGENVDSVLVADGVALFAGQMDEPYTARVTVDGQRYAQFIMESGSISFSTQPRRAFGSQLNDRMNALEDSVSSLYGQYRQTADTVAQKAMYDKYMALLQHEMEENIDNPIGYQLFIEQAVGMSGDELDAAVKKYPGLSGYRRVAKLQEAVRRRSATGVGQKYADFEVNGQRLSDYVGRDGHYLLVDFWASWCGPCIRQTVVLKELYNKYKDKGLDVLGVAVWDKPDDTRAAITRHELPWPCIIGAGTIPTDLYGISGIPCIMLIGPDGTILSRDKQDDELRADVARYLDR